MCSSTAATRQWEKPPAWPMSLGYFSPRRRVSDNSTRRSFIPACKPAYLLPLTLGWGKIDHHPECHADSRLHILYIYMYIFIYVIPGKRCFRESIIKRALANRLFVFFNIWHRICDLYTRRWTLPLLKTSATCAWFRPFCSCINISRLTYECYKSNFTMMSWVINQCDIRNLRSCLLVW